MPTDKQIEASRKNGAKSTGPATDEGKAKSAGNARRHGLSSNSHVVVLSNENRELYKEMLQSFYESFQPANAVEMDLVQQIAAASWRIRRISGMESALYELEMDRQREQVETEFEFIDGATRQALVLDSASKPATHTLLQRYEARARRAYNQALRNLMDLQRERLNRPPAQSPVQPQPAATPEPVHEAQAEIPDEPVAGCQESVSFLRRRPENRKTPNEPNPLAFYAGAVSPNFELLTSNF